MVVTTVSARLGPWLAGSGDFGRALAIKCAAGRTGILRHLNLQSVDVRSSGSESAGREFQQRWEVYAMSVVRNCLFGLVSPAVLGAALSITTTGAMANPCTGPDISTTAETKCLTAIAIPGNPLRSFDISWVNPKRGEYYLGDRSNAGIDVIDSHTLTWKRTIGGFVGIVLNPPPPPPGKPTVNNNLSGPDGVTSHGRWLYGGDGNSTLKVIDLDAPPAMALQQSISTGGMFRVDEMALDSDGDLLLAANNADEPAFATLFEANGNSPKSHVKIITKITIDPSILPVGFGLSMEQPSWDKKTRRYLVSVPIIAGNPSGCNYGQLSGPITCDGGVLVINPETLSAPTAVIGAFDAGTNTGVISLHGCGPNGSSVGPDDNVLLGCTPQNNPANVATLTINATTKAQTTINDITGSDEVWFNKGDGRYYTGSSRDCTVPGSPCPAATQQTPVLGVIDAETNLLIEKVKQSSGSHSVAADSTRNFIFVPQVAPVAVVGPGGDTTTVGSEICGTTNGCIGVFQHGHPHDHDDDGDDDGDDHRADNH
jgi:hypothetical protein